MVPETMAFLIDFLKKESGLVLTPEKSYLVESRLLPLARQQKFETTDELVEAVQKGGNRHLAKAVIEAMTTNETFFFRDKTPFERFKEIALPQTIEARKHAGRLRIWCAAASSGQEPYTLAMILKEERAKLRGLRTEILGSDIDTDILSRAEAGVYSQFEVQRGLPVDLLIKNFTKQGANWQINKDVRAMVSYRQLNLLKPFAASLGKMDIIFCRNVLIYFDMETKKQVFAEMHRTIHKDGFLFLGAAETVVGITEKFIPVPGVSGLYKPV